MCYCYRKLEVNFLPASGRGGYPFEGGRSPLWNYVITINQWWYFLKKISLKQNKSHSRSLQLHLVFINEGPSDWLLWSKIQLTDVSSNLIGCLDKNYAHAFKILHNCEILFCFLEIFSSKQVPPIRASGQRGVQGRDRKVLGLLQSGPLLDHFSSCPEGRIDISNVPKVVDLLLKVGHLVP